MMTDHRNGVDAEHFGSFVAQLRRNRGLTQKQVADKLCVSNKAVSKWECGGSMPDIALLLPLAEVLGVTVEELLHGCRQEESGLTRDEVRELTQNFNGGVSGKGRPSREVKRKRGGLYAFEMILTSAELTLLYLFGDRFGINTGAVSIDTICVVLLPLIFGIWFFFFLREELPSYYDKERICFYYDGIVEMSMPGMSFNNRNWPQIARAGRAYCFLIPVLWPVVYFLLRLALPAIVWYILRLPVLLFIVLGGLFIPMYVMGKKYE